MQRTQTNVTRAIALPTLRAVGGGGGGNGLGDYSVPHIPSKIRNEVR
jgi:hypothetical protein